jgi:hypothetical protein
VAEHPKVFHHVGLLVNESPGLGRVTLYLVFRSLRSDNLHLKNSPGGCDRGDGVSRQRAGEPEQLGSLSHIVRNSNELLACPDYQGPNMPHYGQTKYDQRRQLGISSRSDGTRTFEAPVAFESRWFADSLRRKSRGRRIFGRRRV